MGFFKFKRISRATETSSNTKVAQPHRSRGKLWPKILILSVWLQVLLLPVASATSLKTTLTGKIKPKLSIQGLHVSGNQILNSDGQAVRLVGVNRQSSEYACIDNYDFLNPPYDDASVAAIAAWNTTAVRVPLNEDCWLAINNAPAAYSGAKYIQAISDYVNLLNSHGLVAILDLHWNGAGTTQATDQQPMADEDHAPAFWTSVATTFKNNSSAIFDLYNEPYPDNNSDSTAAWTCLRDGGTCNGVGYKAAGMQELVNTVRSTGATNIVMIGGVNYANSLRLWLQYKPTDPTGNLVASWHSYDTETCNNQTCWDTNIAPVLAQVPVVTGEIGEDGGKHTYIDGLMTWLDGHQSNYLAWAWIVNPDEDFALITDYNGTPTQTYGQGFHDHLASLTNPIATTTTLTAQPSPATVGQNVMLTATIAYTAATPNTPSGSVTFTNTTSGQTIGTMAVSNGVANITTTFSTANTFNITATYSGDTNFGGSSNSLNLIVNDNSTTASPSPTTTGPTITPTPPSGTGSSYNYYLPLLANGANTALGNTTTYVTFQNLATTMANIKVQYYNTDSGTSANLQDAFQLLPKGQKAILPTIGQGAKFGGVVTSDQPLNIVVSEALSAGGSAYNVSSATASTLYSPIALDGAYGGYYTTLIVFNAGAVASSGTIQFYDEQGNPAGNAQNFSNLPSLASVTFKQNDAASGLNSNHAYSAKITGTGTLTAQVIEFGPNNFVATFNTLPQSQANTKIYAPAVFNGGFGYTTGMQLSNPNNSTAQVTISYFNATDGSSAGSKNLTIGANGVAGVYQGAADGPPLNFSGSATISSSQPLVMTVNERGPGTISGTYTGLTNSSQNVALPVMANGFAGFVTGTTILNTGSSATNLTLTYLDGSGNQVGSPQTTTLVPNASYQVYQGGSSGLPNGFFGTALITSTQPLLVTTNALNSNGLFYTYTEPSN